MKIKLNKMLENIDFRGYLNFFKSETRNYMIVY